MPFILLPFVLFIMHHIMHYYSFVILAVVNDEKYLCDLY